MSSHSDVSRTRVHQCSPLEGYLELREEIDRRVQAVLASGQYILGPEVEAFEREFAEYLGAKHAIGVANGTDALVLAIRAAGIRQGDAVVTVSNTAVATVAAIRLAGADPVLVDVDEGTLTMDVAAVEDVLSRGGHRVRALLPVHLYGCCADMEALLRVASENNLLVIEDCAQAHGARYGGRMAGTMGDVGAFSFYPTKNLAALGDGGAVVTSDDGIAERVRLLRQYGWRRRFDSLVEGCNSRLDELQAAILRVRLAYLESDNRRRREVAARYDSLLEGSHLRLPAKEQRLHHVYHQYVVRHPNRDALSHHLEKRGILSAVHYPVPIHLQPAYAYLGLEAGSLPVTEKAAREILSLPMYPQMIASSVDEVVRAILAWVPERNG